MPAIQLSSSWSSFLLGLLLLLSLTTTINGCGPSEEEQEKQAILLEDAYNRGYYDALDCVKRKGGSAYSAADDCEDE